MRYKALLIFLFLMESVPDTVSAQWQHVNFTGNLYVTSLVVDTNNVFIYAGTTSQVSQSFNDGNSWTTGLTHGTVSAYVDGLAMKGDTVFMAAGYSIAKSPDHGSNWYESDVGLPSSTWIYVIAVKDNYIFAGTAKGIYRSSNNGNNWIAVNNGIPVNTMVRSLLIQGNNIYAGTGSGIYLSSNNGVNWTPKNNGLSGVTVYSLALSASNLLAGTFEAGVFTSVDNGDNWQLSSNGLTSSSVMSLVVYNNYVFAGTLCDGVFESTDNGASWLSVNTGLPDNPCIYAMAVKSDHLFVGVWGDDLYKRTFSDILTVNDLKTKTLFQLFPNPIISNEEVTFTYPLIEDKTFLVINNTEGKEVARYELPQGSSVQHLTLPKFLSGVYIARFLNAKFESNVKFVVE